MKKNFDEIIKSSIEEDFKVVLFPDMAKEFDIMKIELGKRIRIRKRTLKTYISTCAMLFIIPIVILLYIYNTTDTSNFKYVISRFTTNYSVIHSKVILYGKVQSINKNKTIKIFVLETIKGKPCNRQTVSVKNVTGVKNGEQILLFLSKDYTLTKGIANRFTLEISSKKIFKEIGGNERIRLTSLKKEVSKN